MNPQLILLPALALALFTFLMGVRLAAARGKDMKARKLHPQKGQCAKKLQDYLPDKTNWIADNYNHLFEQPVIFYFVCIALLLIGQVSLFTLVLAWIYFGLRLIHSWIQTSSNQVLPRFVVFLISWLVLATMIILAAVQVLFSS